MEIIFVNHLAKKRKFLSLTHVAQCLHSPLTFPCNFRFEIHFFVDSEKSFSYEIDQKASLKVTFL